MFQDWDEFDLSDGDGGRPLAPALAGASQDSDASAGDSQVTTNESNWSDEQGAWSTEDPAPLP